MLPAAPVLILILAEGMYMLRLFSMSQNKQRSECPTQSGSLQFNWQKAINIGVTL